MKGKPMHNNQWKATAIGTLGWLCGVLTLRLDVTGALLALAACVAVPLAFGLVDFQRATASRISPAAVRLQPWAALLLVASLTLERGALAGILAGPWLLLTALVAIDGLWSQFKSRQRSLGRFAFDLAGVYLGIGGLWTVISRAGWRPLDFSTPIVQLTAVHFHYAGYVLPVLAGLAARKLPGRAAPWALSGVLAGVPLLALGITCGGWLELITAFALCGAAVAVGVGQLRLAARATQPATLLLWGVSGVSLLGGMALAAVYAGTHFRVVPTGVGPWLDIPRMAATHGLLNAVGFSLAGLAAWHISARAPARPGGADGNTSGRAQRNTTPRPRQTA